MNTKNWSIGLHILKIKLFIIYYLILNLNLYIFISKNMNKLQLPQAKLFYAVGEAYRKRMID